MPEVDPQERHEIVVIGAGPTGMVAALSLASRGRDVLLVERHHQLYGLPRAGHLDHEALRVFQSLGILDDVLEDARPKRSNRWLNGRGEVMFEFEHWQATTSSYPSASFYQPHLEAVLAAALDRAPTVTVRLGCEVVAIDQRDDEVLVELQSGRGRDVVRAQYVLAADGAASRTRSALGIERDDFGFNQRWLTVDVAYTGENDFREPAVVGDPRRPHFYGGLGKRHHRFEWRLFDHESDAEFSSPAKAWELIRPEGATPENVEIVRQTIFTFEYRLAREWRVGRAFLMGDAAHTMAPCLGQGMCSGVRDAANLAWKLDLVLRGLAGDDLLDTYRSERYPNVKAWSDMSLKAGEIAFTTDLAKAEARDNRLRRGESPDFGGTPILGPGLIHSSAHALAGRQLPQRTVGGPAGPVLLDEVLGTGFAIIVAAGAELDVATPPSIPFTVLRLTATEPFEATPQQPWAVDSDDFYAGYFAEHGAVAVVVRPDRYVYGAAASGEALGNLVADLVADLGAVAS